MMMSSRQENIDSRPFWCHISKSSTFTIPKGAHNLETRPFIVHICMKWDCEVLKQLHDIDSN
jgi:hypothetical protein